MQNTQDNFLWWSHHHSVDVALRETQIVGMMVMDQWLDLILVVYSNLNNSMILRFIYLFIYCLQSALSFACYTSGVYHQFNMILSCNFQCSFHLLKKAGKKKAGSHLISFSLDDLLQMPSAHSCAHQHSRCFIFTLRPVRTLPKTLVPSTVVAGM